MTVFAAMAALALAAGVGYYLGRRAGSPSPRWKKRTSRTQLGRMALGLLMLLTVRRLQRRLRADLRVPAPVALLRVARIRT